MFIIDKEMRCVICVIQFQFSAFNPLLSFGKYYLILNAL